MLLTPNRFEEFDADYNLGLSIIYLFTVIFHFYQHAKLTKNWLRFDVLFIIGYTIVHIQIPYLASIGIEPSDPQFVWINKNVVNFATWMSVVAIVLWMWGYNYVVTKKRKISKTKRIAPQLKINYYKFDFLLLLTFIIFLGLVGPGLFSGVYSGGAGWGEGAEYAYLLLTTLLYLRIIYFFRELPKKSTIYYIFKTASAQKIFSSILLIYVFLFLVSGDRGPVMQVALIIGGLYALYIKPIKLSLLFIFVCIGAFIFSIISLGRGSDADQFNDGNIFERGYANYGNKEEGNITEELATSVRIQYIALDIVPEKHPYLYGVSFVTVGAGVIPFMSSTIIDIFDISRMYKSSSSFFTVLTKGVDSTSGTGSEILADIYINFGLLLTFFIMLLFGLFSGHVYNQTMASNFQYVLIFIVLLYYALSMNRGMLFTPLKDIVYILFFNFLFTKVIK